MHPSFPVKIVGRRPFENQFTLGLVEQIFEQLPKVLFFAKDATLRFIAANSAMATFCGVSSRSGVLGKSARDFFPEASRRHLEAMDRHVMRAARPIADRLLVLERLNGEQSWHAYASWPIIGGGGPAIGLVVVARSLSANPARHPTYQRVAAAIEGMQANPHAQIEMSSLAKAAGVSLSQFERDFTAVLGLSPRSYLIKLKFEAALELLRSDMPIADIADACGYADQSTFSRRFRAVVGMSPSEYRRSFATS